MRIQILIFIIVCSVGLMSCIFVMDEQKKMGSMDTIQIESKDTLQARTYTRQILSDSTQIKTSRHDSLPPVEHIKRDVIVKKFFTAKQIDTKNIHPQEVISFARSLIGIRYKYGSTDPKIGFDCSGFFTYVFTHFNILVPRSSIDFTEVGKKISNDVAKPGDLILFTGTDSTEKFVGHMGMIVDKENGVLNFIHSTSGKQYGVTITPFSDYYKSRYVKTIRIFPENN